MLPKDARILVVDDMRVIRKAITGYLNTLGYHDIIEAENGIEAVNRVRSEPIDFIFMDVVMPNMNGNDALKEIRRFNQTVPVVLVTSLTDRQIIADCREHDFLGYVLKPLTVEDGPQKLAEYLEMAPVQA